MPTTFINYGHATKSWEWATTSTRCDHANQNYTRSQGAFT
ncbi:uncharacterized protein G2W53_043883 [Senna tora]|uniref:Uncharacterized protein n=1 Tax=Senna tora TaxID=362788 RepID=A0A834W0K4_9FABA|nr:uncharacterized protein G2W53_043883 [Senna tora]